MRLAEGLRKRCGHVLTTLQRQTDRRDRGLSNAIETAGWAAVWTGAVGAIRDGLSPAC